MELNSFGLNAHPSGVDGNDGQTHKKTGEYRYHRDGCSDARTQVIQTTVDAKKEGCESNLRYDRDL